MLRHILNYMSPVCFKKELTRPSRALKHVRYAPGNVELTGWKIRKRCAVPEDMQKLPAIFRILVKKIAFADGGEAVPYFLPGVIYVVSFARTMI